MWSRLAARSGFALLIALLAIVALGAIVIAGHQIASSQVRLARASRAANAALYAAEAGIQASVTQWPLPLDAEFVPGETRKLLEHSLATGDGYHVWLTRLDDGEDEWRSLYLIRSVGLAHGSRGGRRQLGLLVRVPDLEALCCFRAVTPSDLVSATPGVRVGPEAQRPDDKDAECDDYGLPPDRGDRAGDSALQRARALYDALSSGADLVVDAPDTTLSGFEGTDRRVVHATGDLELRGGSGSGVLLVDGDLTLSDAFGFRGVLMIRGSLSLEDDGTRIMGTVLLLGPTPGPARLGPGTEVVLSRCEALLSLAESGLFGPRPLAQHAWLEIFN